MFHLTIAMEDLDTFIADPAHQAEAIGYLDGSYIGGQRPVLAGDFNPFANSGDADRKTMLYRLHFENAAGEPLTLSGHKDIRNDFAFRCLVRHHHAVCEHRMRAMWMRRRKALQRCWQVAFCT